MTSIDVEGGGTSTAVASLCRATADSLDNVTLYSLVSPNPVDRGHLGRANYELLPRGVPSPLHSSAPLRRALDNAQVDVFHGHGLWQLPVHYMVRAAVRRNIPAVLAPHGMLNPAALRFSHGKKRVAGWLFQNRDLRSTHCLHATSRMEADSCRRYGLRNPIAVIPNGLDLKEFPAPSFSRSDEDRARKQLLYLSRLHPTKGLPLLLEAWASLASRFLKWELVIAGNGEPQYQREMQEFATRLHIADRVSFRGPVYGQEKHSMVCNAELFVLPTYTENFGIVVAEALAHGTPVITTKGAPWEDLERHRCGWWIDVGCQPLTRALEHAMSMSSKERAEMGRHGRRLVEEKYSIQSVADRTVELYEWLVRGGSTPGFVRVD